MRSNNRLRVAPFCACILTDHGTLFNPCWAHLKQINGSRATARRSPTSGRGRPTKGWIREPTTSERQVMTNPRTRFSKRALALVLVVAAALLSAACEIKVSPPEELRLIVMLCPVADGDSITVNVPEGDSYRVGCRALPDTVVVSTP